MGRRGQDLPTLDLEALPAEFRAVVQAGLAGAEVTVRRGGRDLGTMIFRPAVVDGVIVATPRLPAPEVDVPEGVLVVAVAMRLSRPVRQRLSQAFGSGFLVLDLHDAPVSTDIVLVNPVSPQLLSWLRERFPASRVVVTEIEDDVLGVHYPGPVGRLLDAGASAYLPPRPVQDIVAGVRAHLTNASRAGLEGPPAQNRQLPPRAGSTGLAETR